MPWTLNPFSGQLDFYESDTGITSYGVGDPVSSGTSGSVLFVDSSGNLAQDNSNLFWDDTENRLGIGTNAPLVPLHVSGNIISEGTEWGFGTTSPNNGRFHIYYSASAVRGLFVENGHDGANAIAQVQVDAVSSGYVLRAYPSAFSSNGSQKADGAEMYANSGTSGGLSIVTIHATADMRFYTGGNADANERIRILSGGNVGIGDTSPSAQLDIVAGSASTVGLEINAAASQTADLVNITSNGGSAGDLVTVDNAGKVGIGTDTPLGKAHIEAATDSHSGLIIRSTDDSNSNPWVDLQSSDGTTRAEIYLTGGVTDDLVLETFASGEIILDSRDHLILRAGPSRSIQFQGNSGVTYMQISSSAGGFLANDHEGIGFLGRVDTIGDLYGAALANDVAISTMASDRYAVMVGTSSGQSNPQGASEVHVRMGGPSHAISVTNVASTQIGLEINAAASQAAHLQEWQDSSSNLLLSVSENGYLKIKTNSAPADAEIDANELALWFDSTNGAAVFNLKGKTADGTVVTGSVNLT